MSTSEPGVTDETQLVIEIGDQQAGGVEGQLILDDVEFGKSRDNDPKHGIGNETPQGISTGNITYTVSASAMLNGAAADLARQLGPDNTLDGELYIEEEADAEFNVLRSKLDWNDVSIEATDDGDAILSVEFDARGPGGDV